ncbi:MAG: hypothetical protein BMS9Abin13_216 [Patescibacteria group bacterium]|nr:MAG: hypothetical protein BMS9Abin13_216 [Patescibacteria group bacterium]
MLEFQEKKKIRRLIYSNTTIVFLVLILIFSLHAVWKVYKKAIIPYANKSAASRTLTELKAREADLTERIEWLKTNQGIEMEIREKFGVVREGEEVVVIVDSSANKEENNGKGAVVMGAWQKLLELFGWN